MATTREAVIANAEYDLILADNACPNLHTETTWLTVMADNIATPGLRTMTGSCAFAEDIEEYTFIFQPIELIDELSVKSLPQ